MNTPKFSKQQPERNQEAEEIDNIVALNQSPLQKAKRINEQIYIQNVRYLINNSLTKKYSQKNFLHNLSTPEKEVHPEPVMNSNERIYCSAFDRIQYLTSGRKDGRSPIQKRDRRQNQPNTKLDYHQSRNKIYNFAHQQFEEDYCSFQKHQQFDHNIETKYKENTQFSSTFQYSQTISTTSSNLSAGLTISDFRLGKQLGAGKFGQVYIGTHKQTGFMCAIKRINKHSLDTVLKKQLIRQIKIQSFLNHPNIVKLYTFFSDQNCIYLILELCTSGQLYHFLKKKKSMISQELGKVIIRQVCQGLDYIHENNIIHRDLKPENILYHSGMMKICDFGWSVDTQLMRDTFCGTPLYLSPELLKRSNYDKKIDSWSLGVLAYQILLGRVPFEIYSEADYIKIIKNEIKLSTLKGISEEAKNFILLCLEKQPQNRISTSEMLEHPFLNKVEVINFPQIF